MQNEKQMDQKYDQFEQMQELYRQQKQLFFAPNITAKQRQAMMENFQAINHNLSYMIKNIGFMKHHCAQVQEERVKIEREMKTMHLIIARQDLQQFSSEDYQKTTTELTGLFKQLEQERKNFGLYMTLSAKRASYRAWFENLTRVTEIIKGFPEDLQNDRYFYKLYLVEVEFGKQMKALLESNGKGNTAQVNSNQVNRSRSRTIVPDQH